MFRFAAVCAGIALLVAPFRASAGLRGGMLVLAVLAIVWLWQRHALRETSLPVSVRRPLFVALGIWVGVVGVLSLVGADPLESLSSWRGDVLTPIAAGAVFFFLTKTPRVLAAWLLILLASLLILTVMVVMDPFRPLVAGHEPRYVSVGWLSTWLVMLGALLPLAWWMPWPRPDIARAAGVLALAAILVAAWFTVSRVVWVCFAVMLLIHGGMGWRNGIPSARRTLAVMLALAGVAMMGALFYAAAATRANLYPDAAPGVSAFMWQDNRAVIWREAAALIAEKPILGHGYALEAPRQMLSSRFADPWFQTVFKHAHNMLLNYAIQLGVVGAATLLLLFGVLGRAFWVARSQSDFSRAIAACGLMLIAGFFLRNMLDDFFSRHAVLLLGALTGMLLAVGQWPNPSSAGIKNKTPANKPTFEQ